MLSQDLIKKIRQIQIYTARAVNTSFAGQYESVFKGRGMQFDEVREYALGDDVRTIDWNVTARTGKVHIKRFVEEREMTVMFMVDLSNSGNFATQGRLKNELAAEFCAVLAFAAIKNNDKVGLIIFTDQIELFVPPRKGTQNVLRLIRELLYFKAEKRKTNIAQGLDYLAKVQRKKATVFLVSDFLDTNFKKSLSLVNRKHDVIAIDVSDPAEKTLPRSGIVELADAETGKTILVDTASKAFTRKYANAQSLRDIALDEAFKSSGVDKIAISTDKPYINDLIKFFHRRHGRL